MWKIFLILKSNCSHISRFKCAEMWIKISISTFLPSQVVFLMQNSLECNSHASFQESFKVNKCMSVPIENFDFLSKLLTNSGVQCRIPSPHHSNILLSLHEQELLMHSYDCVSFLFYLFLL